MTKFHLSILDKSGKRERKDSGTDANDNFN